MDGSLYSSESVAAVKATAVGAGLGDTAMTGPFNTTLTFKSSARLMKPTDFMNGTDQQTITVRLSIVAKPYVDETHVFVITRSSGAPVGPAEPIEAGEKVTVSVKAFDFEGLPISRRDLQLRLEILGNLNKSSTRTTASRCSSLPTAPTYTWRAYPRRGCASKTPYRAMLMASFVCAVPVGL